MLRIWNDEMEDENNFCFKLNPHTYQMINSVLYVDEVEYELESSPELYSVVREYWKIMNDG